MAVMLSKLTTVTSLLIICGASSPQQLHNSKQATSAQTFVRHDVPLSYKYSTVHVYGTEKSKYQKDVPNIQYAPLYSPEELRMKNDLNTNVYKESDIANQNRDIRKDHLEPKEVTGTMRTHYSSYIPGHNIELLQSVNRSPGLNTDYISYPEASTHVSSKSTEKAAASAISKRPSYDPSHQYNRAINVVNPVLPFPPNTYLQLQPLNPLELQLLRNQQRLEDIHELTKQIESQRVSGHPKMNTLLLNLARVYNAHAPINNHINYLDNKQHKVANTQALVKGPAIKKAADHINRVVPIRNKHVN